MRHSSKQYPKQNSQDPKQFRGGEKKVMKKSLSLVVAAAMTLTTASVAFADAAPTTTELTAQQKFDALKALGIFNGYPDGSAGLDKQMTRAEFAKVLTKLAKLTENTAAAKVYTDVPATHWAAPFIGASTEAKLMNGLGANKFGPSGQVTIEQIAKVADLVAGLEPIEGEVSGKVSAWAKGYVAAAVKAGLLPELPSYQTNATRELLVDVTYDLAKPEQAQELAITAKVAGVKKIEVQLNKAVDASKVTFEVKNATGGAVNVSKTTFAADNKSATLEFPSNLLTGDLTITAKGAEKEVSAKVTVEAEKVTKIEFLSDKAVFNRTDARIVTTTVKVSNQYGEDITAAKAGSLTVTSAAGVPTLASNGVLTLDNTKANIAFVKDQKFTVSAVDAGTGTFTSTTLTVSDRAQVAELTIDKLYNADGNTLAVGSDASTFYLEVTAKDQYGNKITDPTIFKQDTLIQSFNPTVVDVSKTANVVTYDANLDGGVLKIQLGGTPAAGTAKVNIISVTSGKSASFDVNVKDAVKVDTLSLSAPAVAVAGSDIEIPFSAVDQFGVAVTTASAINNSGAILSKASSAGTLAFVQDYVKKTPKLVLSGVTAKGPVTITIISGTGKVFNLNLSVVDSAVATVVTGTKDLATQLAKSAVVALDTDNVVVKDQYGRDFTPTWGTANGNYRLSVTSSDSSKVAYDAAKQTLTAAAKGSSVITVALQKNVEGTWTDVQGSAYTYTSKVVEQADLASYESPDVTSILNGDGTGAHDVQVTVNGVLADGSKVAVPNSYFTVDGITSGLNVDVDTNKLHANLTADQLKDGDVTGVYVVTIIGSNQQPITKNIKVSKAASAADKLELQSTDDATKESDSVLSAAKAKVDTAAEVQTLVAAATKTTDQYGVVIPTAFSKVYITSVANNHVIDAADATKSTVVAGDTFSVTALTSNGKNISFQVVVK
ncbi:S-layer homology domain-containing protein [Paenibacillus sp. MWE-103]|uniref:S-layer homology domain-containing protein n=1 Tax=Paenibacillus artemisiicola TaxID=1172618 RepID=A0ABS3WIT3_9BACL|nr:S-layer homology domain-containing protein [Paenibacillus artemisiicola]MBO7748030.1 S-layer homology domain-containing protein [Paenibacillus artemisiicola]